VVVVLGAVVHLHRKRPGSALLRCAREEPRHVRAARRFPDRHAQHVRRAASVRQYRETALKLADWMESMSRLGHADPPSVRASESTRV
jgi:hypothetical protein